MELQEFYKEILQEVNEGILRLDSESGEDVFFYLLCAVEIAQIEECSVMMQADQVVIDGKCRIYGWNEGELFTVRILCMEEEGTIICQASFWSDFEGRLGDFFTDIAPAMIAQENGLVSAVSLVDALWISHPIISYHSSDMKRILPLKFSAAARKPKGEPWNQYDYLLSGMDRLSGKLDKDGAFELAAPLTSVVSVIFPCAGVELLLRNGARNYSDIQNPVISQAGLRISLMLPQLEKVIFTVPLFAQPGHFSLHAYVPNGLGVTDIVNLLLELFHTGGSAAALSLPKDMPLNQFKLFQMDLLAKQQELSLTMEYLMMEFGLAEPWKLPIPYVTLERMGVGFQLTFGTADMGNLVTASAGGALSIVLGTYKLTMDLEMELPELSFTAQAKLEKRQGAAQPGLAELADTFGVTLPEEWQRQNRLLGQITVYGSGTDRSFAIEAGVYDILSFSIGDLVFSLQSVEAGAETATSYFRFWVQGMIEIGEGKDAFSIYLKAVYEDSGWLFAGGLYQGKINIGKLLSQMFQMKNPAEDIFSLSISGLDISYDMKEERLTLTAVFEAAWNIHLLGKDFVLGGRIQVCKEADQEADASALSYLTLGDFKLLAQVDHMQNEQQRNWLFRLQYDELYLQAAWFHRNADEILSVRLGGMTLGGLLESLVNMINPNKRYTLSAPWNLLNKIELSKFLFELNVTKNQAYFLYQADLNLAGLMYVERVGVRYDMEEMKLFFVLTGRLLGVTYGEEDPLKWDAVDGQPPEHSADNEKKFEISYLGMGQHLANQGVAEAKSIEEAVTALKEQLNPAKISQGVSYDAGTNWLFGADVTINGMLNVKIVLNDPMLYGLLLTVDAKQGSALEFLDGFGMELLCRRVGNDIYMFRGELLVPKRYRTFYLGAVSLTLGRIRAEIYSNGGFYLDLGFPHQMDFSRSFVLQWGIFTGRGGIYFGVMKNVSVPNLPDVKNGTFAPIVTLGIGLCVGMGRSFDLGIVKGGVSLEVFGIFEGVLAIFHEKETEKEDIYYDVKAVAGITGRLFLSVDFKIITIQASAEIQASASLRIQAYKASVVELELALNLEAKIKILFIKINFSFSFRQKVTFTMGKDERAPWIETGARSVQKSALGFAVDRLEAVELRTERIHISLIPLFYLANPSFDTDAPKEYGAAFLMMMDQTALAQWTGLLADWALSQFLEDVVTARQSEGISLELADAMTYDMLEDFLSKNAVISYDIHWVEEEQGLQDAMEEEEERFVFPMLPSLAVSFGPEGKEEQVNYWESQLVDQNYFDLLTDYFSKLNPDPSKEEVKAAAQGQKNLQASTMPIAKAFFQDYFRMFLREVIARLQRPFEELVTDKGVCTASQDYGLSISEILRQNTELVFTPGRKLVFAEIRYTIMESDTLARICSQFSCAPKLLWQSVRHETFLLQTGAFLEYGEGIFHNELSQFTLEQAAAFLFARFYEQLAPEDMFYAGDIVRLNSGTYEELDINWKETEPGGHVLALPDGFGMYRTMRGDTPERISRYLNLMYMDKNDFAQWQEFYQNICERNKSQQGQILSEVSFYVPQVLVHEDLDLEDLADRLCPDQPQDALPDARLFGALILKTNTPVKVRDVAFQIPDTGEFTVAMLRNALLCTVEELEQAVLEDAVFCEGQKLRIAGARQMDKAELRTITVQEAQVIGTMLSRFLLQGLAVPAPDDANTQKQDTLPLFEVLGQMFLLGSGQEDRNIKVLLGEPGCAWIETEKQQKVMSWGQIKERLPNGTFTTVPSAFTQMEDFVLSPQYVTLTDGAAVYRGQERLWIYLLSDALQETLKQGQAEPALLNEMGEEQKASWGYMIPLSIELCKEEGVFALYGADAEKRLVLHHLLSLPGLSCRIMYQTSGVSKGGKSFWECDWAFKNSFLARTNLSLETHMGFRKNARDGQVETEHIVELERQDAFLRMVWECSTVGGGGYYLRLETAAGQTLPSDIFDENGMGTLWILLQGDHYAALQGCVNCCLISNMLREDSIVTLVTQDALQEKMQPAVPVGCVGLCAEMEAPSKETCVSDEDEYMRSLFQITGYQIMESADYQKSHISAPLLPEEHRHKWRYQAVAPMYRYVSGQAGQGQQNPYACVGKQGRVALQLRDVLGNMLQMGDTQITPYYNDVLIGVGQYPAAKVSYALTGGEDAPVLRLIFCAAVPDNLSAETVACQRRAAMQLACEDIQVTLSSPVNDEIFSLAAETESGRSYLEMLRGYVNALADAMEGKHIEAVPESWFLDFALHLKDHPIPAKIFELKALLTISRAESLAPEAEAQTTVSEIFPSVFLGEETEQEREKSLLVFCRNAQKVLKNLYFAQKAEGDSVLYGVSYGEHGFLKKLDVKLMSFQAQTTAGEKKTVRAPEYYALSPLYQGFLSRSAAVRALSEEFLLSDSFVSVNFSDVDIELWANQFLEDIETLLISGQVKKAGICCRLELDALVKAKERLACAIAEQLCSLREDGEDADPELKERVGDRLKRSLKDGYASEIAAECQLCFLTQDNKRCRLTAVLQNDMAGTQGAAGKAESQKEKMALFFTNTSMAKSTPLKTDILFTELEYDIEMDADGYESSKWLRFIEPVRLERKTNGCMRDLESEIDLPNPLKACPRPPALQGHTCEMNMAGGEEETANASMTDMEIRWDYSLDLKCLYREQDTLWIRVEFESISVLQNYAMQRDLFDVLAEYSLARDRLFRAVSQEAGESAAYIKAYGSFVDIVCEASKVWGDWTAKNHNRREKRAREEGIFYSCMVEGARSPEGVSLFLTHTGEGLDFIERFGLKGREPYIEAVNFDPATGELEMKLVMKKLPLFSCAQAKPSVKIIRNQNLLTGRDGDITLAVSEAFIYQTQEVSLPILPVAGEYTREYKIAVIAARTITEEVMKQAVWAVYSALQLDQGNLMAELSAEYYYGLNAGQEQPRVLLPITLIPCIETVDMQGSPVSFIENLTDNLYQWYQEMQPVTNACGLLFDIKIYQKNNQKLLLHFSGLNVGIELRSISEIDEADQG